MRTTFLFFLLLLLAGAPAMAQYCEGARLTDTKVTYTAVCSSAGTVTVTRTPSGTTVTGTASCTGSADLSQVRVDPVLGQSPRAQVSLTQATTNVGGHTINLQLYDHNGNACSGSCSRSNLSGFNVLVAQIGGSATFQITSPGVYTANAAATATVTCTFR